MTELVKSTRNGPFSQALADFVSFFEGYSNLLKEEVSSEGRLAEAAIGEALGRALVEQTIQLNNRFLTVYDDESAQDVAKEFDDYTEATALNLIARAASESVSEKRVVSRSGGLLSGLFPGLGDILEPIKKILKLIMGAFPKIFGGKLGNIINTILDIINNLFGNAQKIAGPEASERAESARRSMYEHLQLIYETETAASFMRRAQDDEE